MAFLIGGANSAAADTAFSVANSCRFEDGDSASLNRTTGTPTNVDKYTFSVWVKRGNIGIDNAKIFSIGSGSYGEEKLEFNSDDLIWRRTADSDGEIDYQLVTNAKYRDPTAWMHIVCAYDSSDGTAGDRMKMYINGVRETSFSATANPDSNENSLINTASGTLYIGRYKGSAIQHFDGYMAELAFIDGTDYAASDFGEYNEDSPTIWQPKKISTLTFGDNGFYCDFEDSGNLGDDESGNTNDLGETNIAAADQATDTPTNNFATYNPLVHASTAAVFSQGNCKVAPADDTSRVYTVSTLAMPKKAGSKWYAEFQNSQNDDVGLFGILDAAQISNVFVNNSDLDDQTSDVTIGRCTYRGSNGKIHYPPDGEINDGTTLSDNDIVMVALDAGAGKAYFGVNGTWLNSADPANATNPTDFSGESWVAGVDEYVFIVGDGSTGGYDHAIANFGGCPAFAISSGNADADGYGNFEYAVPSGFFSLCTKNLAEYG